MGATHDYHREQHRFWSRKLNQLVAERRLVIDYAPIQNQGHLGLRKVVKSILGDDTWK